MIPGLGGFQRLFLVESDPKSNSASVGHHFVELLSFAFYLKYTLLRPTVYCNLPNQKIVTCETNVDTEVCY